MANWIKFENADLKVETLVNLDMVCTIERSRYIEGYLVLNDARGAMTVVSADLDALHLLLGAQSFMPSQTSQIP